MVVTSITNYVLFGSSTDTKPLAGIAAQTLYFEIDTGRVYKFTGGVWSLFSGDNKPETLTNKTLTTPAITSIKTATGNVNIPAGPQTLIGTSTTDTLTNKTLIAPAISTINNGGVITLPSGTRTLMARDTNDTMLNKTINVNSNTLTSNTPAAGDLLISNGTNFIRLARGTTGQVLTATASTIQWAAAAGGGGGLSASTPNTFTAVQTFNDSMLAIRNPANTFSVTLNAGSQTANRTFTFPITGTDTIQTVAATQSPTNKTLTIDQNTFKHSTTNADGDILVNNGTQFARLARGGTGQVLTATATSINWATPTPSGGSTMLRDFADYIIYYSGTQYEALNGNTGAVDYTNTTDAAAVINSAITALNTAGGGMIRLKGTLLCRSTIITKSLVSLIGAGDGAVIKQDATQNLAVLVDSLNFATLTGTGTSGGVYGVFLSNLQIDGNKANNTTTATIGLRYYGYNWHVQDLHIKQCKGIGMFTEWSTDPVSPTTGTTMDSYYNNVAINLCDGIGWQNRGPHDSMIVNSAIYTCGGTGYLQEYLATKYDGSLEMVSFHIFDVPGKGMDITGGTLRFRGVTSESINNAGSIGLHINGGTVQGAHFEAYLAATGIKAETGGSSILSAVVIHDCTTDGIEVLKNDMFISGIVYNNGPKGIVLGTGAIALANVRLDVQVSGHTTAQVDWANANHQGIAGDILLYTDSTHATAVLGSPDFEKNSIMVENLANGTAIRYTKAKPMAYTQVKKSPFYQRYGCIVIGHNVIDQEGLMLGANFTSGIAGSFSIDGWEGSIVTYGTGTTSNTRAGLNANATTNIAPFTRRMNPILDVRYKVTANAANNARLYVGFSSAATLPASNTPLGTTDKGVIVGFSTAQTNYSVFQHNGDGTAAAAPATYSGLTLAKTDLNWHRITIVADDTNGKFTVSIDNNTPMVINTKIPASGDFLAVYAQVQNSGVTNEQIIFGSSIEVKTNFIP